MTKQRFPSTSLALAFAFVGAACPGWATDRWVNPDGLCSGNTPCYSDLQSAITASAPGDVIHVQPGLYALAARVDVTQSVRILGPQAGVNPLPSNATTRTPGDPLTEAILDGGNTLPTLLRILASDVEVDGFEVRNGTGDLIDSQAATPTSNVAVRNNIVHDSSGDEGIQLRAVAHASIECNHVYGTAGDGINLCCGSTDGQIRWNEVHDISSLDAAVYVYYATNTTITGNLIYNSFTNEGIKVGAKNVGEPAGIGGTISGNIIHDTHQDGIAIYASNSVVTCNQIYGSTSENGCIYLAYPISNVTVTDNDVHDNVFDTFKWGDPAGIMIGPEVDAATVTVRDNRLANNTPNGLTNKAVAVLVAENNWWGDASGPGGVGPGLGDRVSTNVDYDPWLGSPPAFSCPVVGLCGLPPVGVAPRTWGAMKALYR